VKEYQVVMAVIQAQDVSEGKIGKEITYFA